MSNLSVSLTFTPATQPIAEVLGAVHRLYGASAEAALAAVLPLADRPDVGADADDAGPVAATANADGTVIFDANGLPWDKRIHSTPAKQTAAGVWRKGRNVTDATLAAVIAELRSRHPAPVAAPAPATTSVTLPAVGGPGVAGLPALGALPAVVTPAAPTKYQLFAEFVGKNMVANGGRITPEWLKQSLTAMQVADGELQNLAGASDDVIVQIHTAIAGAIAAAPAA